MTRNPCGPVAIAIAVLLALGATPLAARAASHETEAKFRALEARLGELERKLEATSGQLEQAQGRLREQQALLGRVRAGDASPAGAASFLDTIEVSGWTSASYNYNFENPDDGQLDAANSGAGGIAANPFKADSNSFAFDQLWFEIERPVSEARRAGFRADLVYGKSAGLLSGLSGGDGASGNDLEVYQAFVQYQAPLGPGVTFQVGKFATLIGAEVVQAPSNFNITRGQVYNLFQPITHTGVLASTRLGAFDLSLGLVNGTRNFPASDIDVNNNKALLFALSRELGESVSLSLAGIHGAAEEAGGGSAAGDKETILDLILSWSPSERFEAYLNADYISTENSAVLCDESYTNASGDAVMNERVACDSLLASADRPNDYMMARDGHNQDVDGFGVAVAGRYALSKRTGVALRGEYLDLDGFFGDANDTALEMFTLTGTVDHLLAENLLLRGELRFDSIEEAHPNERRFRNDRGEATEDDQLLGGIELIYSF